MKAEEVQGEILQKLRQLCSHQEKCTGDIKIFLKRHRIEEPLQSTIIDTLKSEKFLDDGRFSAAFVRDKMKFDHWGMIKIRHMLNYKGIEKKIVDCALAQIDLTEYKKMIGNELHKKKKTLKGTPYEIWAKLARYGSSKGYEMEFMEEFLGEPGT